MQVLTGIPFELSAEALMEQVRVKASTDDAREFSALLDVARTIARPKAIYRECFIEAKGDLTVTMAGITFTSRVLRRNLDRVERVFPFIATCGHEMDQVPLPDGDFLKGFWRDTIKSTLLGFAVDYLGRHLAGKFGLGKTATMSPGEGDVSVWPIEQQRELFSLLGDVTKQIGVVLTDSMLMIPNKTRSGIVFPTETDFHTCQLCQRQDCPARRTPFDRPLWEAMHGADAGSGTDCQR